MPVPLTVPVAAPTRLGRQEREAVTKAIARVVSDGPWVGGTPVEQFEREFAEYLGASEVVGVGNGSDGLALAFAALDLTPGSAILIAANEGGYAATAARQVGLNPVAMDVDATTRTVSAASAAAAMTADVAAIVVTHLHGDAVDLRALDGWRHEHGLRMIEDCAQATGLRVETAPGEQRHVGFTGDASVFSFYPTKNLGAIGDGGALVFADPEHAGRARALAQYGWGERFRVELPGGRNSRLDPLQAAILSARLPFLDARNAVRRDIRARYQRALDGAALVYGDAATSVAHHSVAITNARDSLAQWLTERGIQTARHYPHLLTEMPGLRLDPTAPTPEAAKLRDQSLSLPSYPEMTPVEVDLVVAALKEWVRA